MLRLFVMKNTVFDDEEKFSAHLALVDGVRRERVNGLVDRRAKNACLSAGVILPLALAKCGSGGEVRTETDERGKPRLIKPEGVFFNLSHSEEYTLIALSDGEVGCDIQQIKPVNLQLAERYFHPEEARAIRDCCGVGNVERQTLFYRYWTAKESFIKATGEGFHRPLNTFYISLPRGEVRERHGSLTRWRVAESGEIEGYRIAVCSQTLQPFTVEELFIGEGIL